MTAVHDPEQTQPPAAGTGGRAPLISVVLPVHNGARYLREAVESILGQTCADFECLVIDDGSTDATAAVLDGWHDPRLVRLRNPENLGLVASLNRGLTAARGAYVARMDADDVALPTRLVEQADFLTAHPEVAVVGAQVERMDERGRPQGVPRLPTEPAVVAWRLQFTNPLCHPATMFRRKVVQQVGGYREARGRWAQDYDLWMRVSRVGRLAQLDRVLLRYRIHAHSISVARGEEQTAVALALVQENFAALSGVPVPMPRVDEIRHLLGAYGAERRPVAPDAIDDLVRFMDAFARQQQLDAPAVARVKQDLVEMLVTYARIHACEPVSRCVLRKAFELDPEAATAALLAGIAAQVDEVRALRRQMRGLSPPLVRRLGALWQDLRERLPTRGAAASHGRPA